MVIYGVKAYEKHNDKSIYIYHWGECDQFFFTVCFPIRTPISLASMRNFSIAEQKKTNSRQKMLYYSKEETDEKKMSPNR